MKRPWHISVGFGLCLAVVLTAMAWISSTVLRLDAADADARRQAAMEENVRLALWRMDSALAPLIAQESARPYFAYGSFYPAERAYTKMYAELKKGEVLMPSALLHHASPHVLLHFQFNPEGKLTSPQVPTGNERDLAESGNFTTWQDVDASCLRLDTLKTRIDSRHLLAELDRVRPVLDLAPEESHVIETVREQLAQAAGQISAKPQNEQTPAQEYAQNDLPQQQELQIQDEQQGQQSQGQQSRQNSYSRSVRGSVEYQKRATANQMNSVQMANDNRAPSLSEVREGVARPMWLGDDLLLVRRVLINGKEYVQGCWLDWPNIRNWLKENIADLLPEAELKPVTSYALDNQPLMLAALPVEIVPGPAPAGPAPSISPVRMSVIMAWVCVLLAALAVGVLLQGVVALSERRGAFVSAVTHELRTPLTTFRMYTEMLADGMVTSPDQRQHYLKTLQTEANRLAHLVENVLSYARIERGRAPGRGERVTVQAILDRVEQRLADRARQADLQLIVERNSPAISAAARCDLSAVEQILFNLVDNACKYAATASERRLTLEVGAQGKFVVLRLRDHGPGISKREQSRLFQPFSKSAKDAAHSAPGVGLGLALSRRLARDMGGDLRFVPASQDDPGACFVLTLPVG